MSQFGIFRPESDTDDRVPIVVIEAEGQIVAEIKATCPTCGDVTLGPKDLYIRGAATKRSSGEPNTYVFKCLGCGLPVEKEVDDATLRLLRSVGVLNDPRAWESNLLLSDPPLEQDDLIDLGRTLTAFPTLTLDRLFAHESRDA